MKTSLSTFGGVFSEMTRALGVTLLLDVNVLMVECDGRGDVFDICGFPSSATAALIALFLDAHKCMSEATNQYEKWRELPGDNSEAAFDRARDRAERLKKLLGDRYWTLGDAIKRQQRAKGTL